LRGLGLVYPPFLKKMDFLNIKPKRLTEVWGVDKSREEWRGIVLGKGSFYKLDHISSYIWENINGERSVKEIIGLICHLFPSTDKKTIESDVIELLRKWEKEELISFDYKSLESYIENIYYNEYRNLGKDKVEILLASVPSSYPRDMILERLLRFPPLGIGYVTSFLKKFGFKTECIDLAVLDNRNIVIVLENIIDKMSPKIIGFSVNTEQINSAFTLAKLCKKINPEIKIIFGGVHPTFMDKEILKNPNVDIVVRNEGEFTMLEIAKCILHKEGDLKNIDGISFKDDKGNIIRNKCRAFIENLDEIPFPERNFLIPNISKNRSSLPISTSRGCPYRCNFCAAGAMAGGKYRMRSPENVMEEIRSLKKRGVKTFHFVDDTVTGIPKRVKEICELLKPLDIEWTAESRVDVISRDRELAKIMKDSGCIALQFGIESASQEILDNANKKIKLEQIIKALEFAREEGIHVAGSMIIGHPDDTYESVKKSIDFAVELQRKFGIAVFWGIFTPFPGTPVFENPELFGIKIHTYNFEEYIIPNAVISTKYLNKNQLKWLYIEAVQKCAENLPSDWINYIKERKAKGLI